MNTSAEATAIDNAADASIALNTTNDVDIVNRDQEVKKLAAVGINHSTTIDSDNLLKYFWNQAHIAAVNALNEHDPGELIKQGLQTSLGDKNKLFIRSIDLRIERDNITTNFNHVFNTIHTAAGSEYVKFLTDIDPHMYLIITDNALFTAFKSCLQKIAPHAADDTFNMTSYNFVVTQMTNFKTELGKETQKHGYTPWAPPILITPPAIVPPPPPPVPPPPPLPPALLGATVVVFEPDYEEDIFNSKQQETRDDQPEEVYTYIPLTQSQQSANILRKIHRGYTSSESQMYTRNLKKIAQWWYAELGKSVPQGELQTLVTDFNRLLDRAGVPDADPLVSRWNPITRLIGMTAIKPEFIQYVLTAGLEN